MTDPEALIAQIKQSAHEVSEVMFFGGSDYPVKAIPYAKFLEVLGVFERTHAAEARAAVVAEEPQWEYGWEADEDVRTTTRPRGPRILFDGVPYPPEAIAAFARGRRIRRRKAGPWVPVKQEGAE